MARGREHRRLGARFDGREYRGGPHLLRLRIRPSDRLLAYTTRHLGFATPDAEDLVQELWVRLPELIPSDKPVQDAFTYLVCCIQNFAANDRRKEQRHARLLEQQPPAATVDSDPEGRLVAFLTAEQLVGQLLDRLPPADAKLLRWRFLEGRPIGEIAERLGIPEFTIWSRLRRALTKARAVMESDGQ